MDEKTVICKRCHLPFLHIAKEDSITRRLGLDEVCIFCMTAPERSAVDREIMRMAPGGQSKG